MNSTISKFCYSFYMVIITLYNSKILLSLDYFFTPQFQTFINLLTGIFGVSNHTFFFFEIGRNYVSTIVNIIISNTVWQCCLLWIFVSVRRLLQLIVCTGVSTPPPPFPPQKHHPFFFFAKPLLKSANYPSPHPHPKRYCFFMHPPTPSKSNFSVNSHSIKIFHN